MKNEDWAKRYRELSTALTTGKITDEEFARLNSEGNQTDAKISVRLLNEAFDNKDTDAVEEAIREASPSEGFSNDFSEIFCKLLQVSWHYKHEDIARILQDIKDPATVNCLYNAAKLKFDYLDYDDTYQFARKCIKALSAIDNETAINKLQLLAQNKTPEIKQYAVKELKYKGLL